LVQSSRVATSSPTDVPSSNPSKKISIWTVWGLVPPNWGLVADLAPLVCGRFQVAPLDTLYSAGLYRNRSSVRLGVPATTRRVALARPAAPPADPAAAAAAELAAELAADPAAELAAELAADPAAELAADPAADLAAAAAAAPTPEPAADPAAEPTADPSALVMSGPNTVSPP